MCVPSAEGFVWSGLGKVGAPVEPSAFCGWAFTKDMLTTETRGSLKPPAPETLRCMYRSYGQMCMLHGDFGWICSLSMCVLSQACMGLCTIISLTTCSFSIQWRGLHMLWCISASVSPTFTF